MVILRATTQLKLRQSPGYAGPTLGYLRPETLVYAVGGFAEADGLTWLNVAGPCEDGAWYAGWCAGGQDGQVYLAGYELPGLNIDFPLAYPIPITQLFGENPAIYAKLNYAGHNGLDFGCAVGTPVIAVDAGAVTHARNDPSGYGNYVRIDHAWGVTLYAHLNRLQVSEGGWVGRGTTIGLSGNTGMSTGAHLHFELRMFPTNDGNGFGGRIDPLPFLPKDKLLLPSYMPDALRGLLGKP